MKSVRNVAASPASVVMFHLFINDPTNAHVLVKDGRGRLQRLVQDFTAEGYGLPSYGIVWSRIRQSRGGYAQYVRHTETDKLYLVRIISLEAVSTPPMDEGKL